MRPCRGEGFKGEPEGASASYGALRVGRPPEAPGRLLPSYGHAPAVRARSN